MNADLISSAWPKSLPPMMIMPTIAITWPASRLLPAMSGAGSAPGWSGHWVVTVPVVPGRIACPGRPAGFRGACRRWPVARRRRRPPATARRCRRRAAPAGSQPGLEDRLPPAWESRGQAQQDPCQVRGQHDQRGGRPRRPLIGPVKQSAGHRPTGGAPSEGQEPPGRPVPGKQAPGDRCSLVPQIPRRPRLPRHLGQAERRSADIS
jgi:hypothetical protein